MQYRNVVLGTEMEIQALQLIATKMQWIMNETLINTQQYSAIVITLLLH